MGDPLHIEPSNIWEQFDALTEETEREITKALIGQNLSTREIGNVATALAHLQEQRFMRFGGARG